LLHHKKVGALLRCFAREPGLVENAVALAMASVRTMLSVSVAGRPFISQIEILVPNDPSYAEVDCGETASRLRMALDTAGIKQVKVCEVEQGDIFVGLLNFGVARLIRAGCDYGVILSKEAESYFTEEAASDLIAAAEAGARVAGIALEELTESIMQGRIANTFAMWDLMSLVRVGVFDARNAKPKKDAVFKSRAEGWKQGVFYSYDNAGVEEIIPIIRLIRMFGECVAPILPRGNSVKKWKMPDPKLDPEGYTRSVNKLGMKFFRQSHCAQLESTDPELSFLKGGVMKQYRHPEYIA
jgi:hypothetical protein